MKKLTDVVSKAKQNAFTRGAVKGFKRINIRKSREDCRDEYAVYVAGYVVGFLLKVALVLGAARYGLQIPA